jgi:RNA polymerase sigma-70 factor, ECF subfamily
MPPPRGRGAPGGPAKKSEIAREHSPGGRARSVQASLLLDTFPELVAPTLDPRTLAEVPVAAELLRQGDLAALGQIYDEHHHAVRMFARRLLGEDAAEDLVHDTFLSLPKALQRWNGIGALRTFIIGVAINHARHHVRAKTRRWRAMARFAQEPEHEAYVSPEHDSEQRRLAAMLMRALDTLSFDHRTTFVLAEIEERSSPEVAQILGIPEATVRTRLHYARQKLRVALEREGAR